MNYKKFEKGKKLERMVRKGFFTPIQRQTIHQFWTRFWQIQGYIDAMNAFLIKMKRFTYEVR